MRYLEFLKSSNLKSHVFILNGDEYYFKHKIKNHIKKTVNLPITYVDAELGSDDFYSKIETMELFPEPKIFYIDNESGNLKKHKFFWKNLDKDSKYIINNLKKIPDNAVEIKCDKIKDNAREVTKFVNSLFQELCLVTDARNLPLFYALYKNDLFTIYHEISKCKYWAEANDKVEITYPEIKKIVSPIQEKNIFEFVNFFRLRKLKGAVTLLKGIKDDEMLLYSYHLFRALDHVLGYKSAKKMGEADSEIIKGLEINIYYLKYNLQQIAHLWNEEELKTLLIILEDLNLKIRTLNFPASKAIMNITLKYCR